MACKVERPIEPPYFTDIPRTREAIKSLPEEVRTCSECGGVVTISESDPIPNPGSGAPFGKAALVGCDTSIDRVIEGIRKLPNKA